MGRKTDTWRSGLVDFVGVPLASDVFGESDDEQHCGC